MRLAMLLLLLPLLSAAQQSASMRENCAIDGTVVNGVTAVPVARAAVSAVSANGSRAVRADEFGRWRIENVVCGSVTIVGSKPGFLSTAPTNRASGQTVQLVSGQPAHDYKLTLMPQIAVAGHVEDGSGDPVMNVQIAAFAARVVSGRRIMQITGVANTNDLGEFRIAGLHSGRYTFCAAPAQSSTVQGESCYPASPGIDSSASIALSAGTETRVNFTLPEVPTFHIRGALSGLTSTMRPALALSEAGRTRSTSYGAQHMGPDGRFDIASVRPGSYILSADVYQNNQHFYARTALDVLGSDVEGIDMHLEPAFDVAVRVSTEPAGKSFKANFPVRLRPAQSVGVEGGARWNATAGPVVAGLTSGAYTLEATPPEPFYVKHASLGSVDLLTGNPVTINGPVTLDLVLADDGGTLEGDVKDSEGKPVACWVLVMRNGRARTLYSDEAGHFRLRGLSPGDYSVYAWQNSEDVEYANPEWLRRFTGTPATVNSGGTSQVQVTESKLTDPARAQ